MTAYKTLYFVAQKLPASILFSQIGKLSFQKKQLLYVIPQTRKINFSTSSVLNNVIYQHEEKVPVNGTLNIEIPFNAKISSQEGAEMHDKANFRVSSEDAEIKNSTQFETKLDNSVLKFHATSKSSKLAETTCEAVIPIQFNVNADIKGPGSVSISDIESKSVAVKTESGDINCKRVTCETVNLYSQSGNIQCPSVIKGNIYVQTEGEGKITGARFQGPRIQVETQRGPIDLSAIYSETCEFKSASGEMLLDNFHGNGTVNVKEGKVKITGLDGSLRAEIGKGEISVQVSRLDGLYLSNKDGNVEVKVPTNLQSRVEVEAQDVEIEKRLQVQGKFKVRGKLRTFRGVLGAGRGPIIMVLAPKGLVRITVQDWVASVGGMIPEFGPNDGLK